MIPVIKVPASPIVAPSTAAHVKAASSPAVVETAAPRRTISSGIGESPLMLFSISPTKPFARSSSISATAASAVSAAHIISAVVVNVVVVVVVPASEAESSSASSAAAALHLRLRHRVIRRSAAAASLQAAAPGSRGRFSLPDSSSRRRGGFSLKTSAAAAAAAARNSPSYSSSCSGAHRSSSVARGRRRRSQGGRSFRIRRSFCVGQIQLLLFLLLTFVLFDFIQFHLEEIVDVHRRRTRRVGRPRSEGILTARTAATRGAPAASTAHWRHELLALAASARDVDRVAAGSFWFLAWNLGRGKCLNQCVNA